MRETNNVNSPMEEQDLSFLIKKVEFQIHESFPEPLIVCDKEPYEIHNAGYGEFPITITITFNDPLERPLEYTHQLKFEADPTMSLEQNKQQKRLMAPVIYERYNEIVFYEPTEAFAKVLTENSYDNWVKTQTQTEVPQLADLAAKEEAALNISRYQNYLSIN